MAQRVAVVIGINYSDFSPSTPAAVQERAGRNPLRYAEADATDLAAALHAAGYEVAALIGQAATRAAIIRTIEQQGDRVDPDGVFVVHFAGHGDVDRRQRAYLLPADVDPESLAASAVQ